MSIESSQVPFMRTHFVIQISKLLALSIVVAGLNASCASRPTGGRVAPAGDKAPRSMYPITAEDLAGIMGLTFTKMQIPKTSKGWVFTISLERQNRPVEGWNVFDFPPGDAVPFLIGYKGPPPGEGQIDIIRARHWDSTLVGRMDNPKCQTRLLRDFSEALKPGRTVVILWNNQGQHGWDPGDHDFIQRVVVDLREKE